MPTGQDFSFDITGCSTYPDEILEPIVMRLELVIGNAPILDRQIGAAGVEKFLAITFQVVSAVNEICYLSAETLPVPVHEGATQSLSRKEAFPPPDRQCPLVGSIPKGNRDLHVILHHRLAN